MGNSATLTATVAPDNATNKAVTWSTSDPAKATVANGVVTAVAAGSAIITVTTKDGGKSDVCSVTVTTNQTPIASDYIGTWEGSGEGWQATITINEYDMTFQCKYGNGNFWYIIRDWTWTPSSFTNDNPSEKYDGYKVTGTIEGNQNFTAFYVALLEDTNKIFCYSSIDDGSAKWFRGNYTK